MKNALVLFIFFVSACSETQPEISNEADDMASDLSTDTEMLSDVQPDADVSLENPCSPAMQSWDLNEVRDGFGEGIYQHTHQVEHSATEVFAKVENGALRIEIPTPIRAKDEIDITILAHKNGGSLPGTQAFPPNENNTIPEDETYANYSSWRDSTTYRAPVQSVGGALKMNTCPNEVGQFAIGELIDAELGYVFSSSGIINGTFSVLVTESDGTLDCGTPQLCDY